MNKRISFGNRDAEHIFEWAMALRQAGVECLQKDCGCPACERIVNRIEKFIGKKSVNGLNRLIKKQPYFSPKKR